MNEDYIFFIEERWQTRETITISDKFYKKLLQEKREIIETKNNSIKFTYVGIISYQDEVIIILPKYFDERYNNKLSEISTIIKVLKRIPKIVTSQYEGVNLFLRNENIDIKSEIALADFIIKDFIEYGFYNHKTTIYEINQGANICWPKTINELQPIITDQAPIYHNVYNKKALDSTYDFIAKVHKGLVELCISKYGKLLGYEIKSKELKKCKKRLERLGDKRYICNRILKQLNSTYSDREVKLLKMMYSFFREDKVSTDNNLSLYGTNTFEFIWEYVLGELFNNEYDKFRDSIPKPQWRAIDGNWVINERNILIPDIIRVYNKNLFILDAKYYLIHLTNSKIKGNPDTYDIVKQYTYEVALENIISAQTIINAFIYPMQGDNLFNIFGVVKLDIFNKEPILNIYMSPQMVWNRFLCRKKLDDIELDELVNKVKGVKKGMVL